jgi:hypothetical protein
MGAPYLLGCVRTRDFDFELIGWGFVKIDLKIHVYQIKRWKDRIEDVVPNSLLLCSRELSSVGRNMQGSGFKPQPPQKKKNSLLLCSACLLISPT